MSQLIPAGEIDSVLRLATPLFVTDERTIQPGETFTAEWKAPDDLTPFNARWILVRTDEL